MSEFQSTGLSINVFEPTIVPTTPLYTPLGRLVEGGGQFKIDSYSHVLAALGGYESASFSLTDNLTGLENWLDRIGYYMRVTGPHLGTVWEGFINQVQINVGPLTVVRGPLIDIGNRVQVVYSTVDTTTTPPTVGQRARTATATNATSQARYGIIQYLLSVGGATDVTALQIRDTWLADNDEPVTSQMFNSGSAGQLSATINCLGYWAFLDLYVYNQIANTGTLNVSTAIQNALAADINGLFSTDYSRITANTLQTQRYVNDDNTAWGYIKFLVSQGDANDNRYLFGIYANRQAVYNVQPTTLEYIQRLTDNRLRVETPGGIEVKPWDVQPGKWLLYPDFMVGRSTPANFRDDPRMEFIERVTYVAPFGLTHTGSKTATLPQKLAKLGLGGTG